MRSLLLVVGIFTLIVSASPLSGSTLENRAAGSKAWVGTNSYFLHGVSDDRQSDYIATLKSFGITILRVWVRAMAGGGTCEKGSKIDSGIPALETTLGEYNNETLDAVDKIIQKLADNGIKAIVSPHDANSLDGNADADVYSNQFHVGGFYTTQEAFDMYDNRLSYILNYRGKYSGMVWKDWQEGIAAFDLQNEPMVTEPDLCQTGDQAGWICGRAQHLRKKLGADNPIKIASGGIGGDVTNNCHIISAATECDALDLIAVHRYAGANANWASSGKDWISKANDKLVFVEEWGIDQTKLDPVSVYASNMQDFIDGGLPNMYWQILPSFECDYDPKTDGDHFGLAVDSGVDFEQWIEKENQAQAAQDWLHFTK